MTEIKAVPGEMENRTTIETAVTPKSQFFENINMTSL